jgi:hypothetical protein
MSCQRGLLSIKLTLLIDAISLDDRKYKVTSLQGPSLQGPYVEVLVAGNMPMRSPSMAIVSL